MIKQSDTQNLDVAPPQTQVYWLSRQESQSPEAPDWSLFSRVLWGCSSAIHDLHVVNPCSTAPCQSAVGRKGRQLPATCRHSKQIMWKLSTKPVPGAIGECEIQRKIVVLRRGLPKAATVRPSPKKRASCGWVGPSQAWKRITFCAHKRGVGGARIHGKGQRHVVWKWRVGCVCNGIKKQTKITSLCPARQQNWKNNQRKRRARGSVTPKKERTSHA